MSEELEQQGTHGSAEAGATATTGALAATGTRGDEVADNGTLRLHLLAENARGPLTVVVGGRAHQLEAGTPAKVHELDLPAGTHRLEFSGRVLGGSTGRVHGLVDVAPGEVCEHYYALPVVPGMRGELLDEPDKVPGHEWRIIVAAVGGLVLAVYLVWFGSVLLGLSS